MARHAAKQNRWARRAVVAGALPVAIVAASAGTAHAQDTGSANIPALPEMPQIEVPPLYNPYDLNARPFNVLQLGYAPTPQQRVADYTDTGQFLGATAGHVMGGSLIGVPVGAIAAAVVAAGGPASWPVTLGPAMAATAAATLIGGFAGGSVGADLGANAATDLANQHNAEGRTGSL
ncbi:hypothetical protein [Rhodococcus sp. AG1013]|uniref:hypothetical protein n=1 Tax=unclassified Rhodococcus (in: high G+C Gram-positive bacteria) TaxID=192944 RepID=UPI000E0C7175|nr:hypothetical protein [Rhodococcus sp. AG1013]RDI18013.1 hypothetical protein DEU38_12150 [Rhodococcus sp. AG1013]